MKENGAESCATLVDTKKFKECESLKNSEYQAKIYTEERKAITLKIFNEAKLDATNYLTNLKERLPLSHQPTIDEMISRLKKARLFFSAALGDQITFNATALKDYSEGEETFNVFIEGLVLYADSAPETLYHSFAHELAHFVEKSEFYDHPMEAVVGCLKSRASIGAKPNDVECISRLVTERTPQVGLKFPSVQSGVSWVDKRALELVKRKPDATISIANRFGQECQLSQVGEAYADWFAAELLVKSRHRGSITKSVGVLCSGYQQGRAFKANEGNVAFGFDPHPSDFSRVNRLLATQPEILKEIGCEKLGTTAKYCEMSKEKISN